MWNSDLEGKRNSEWFIGVQRLLSINTEDEPDSMKASVLKDADTNL